MIRQISVSAPGKIIITGEHFVVHGSYAVAAAINKRVTVHLLRCNGRSRIVSDRRQSFLDENDGTFRSVKAIAKEILARSAVLSEGLEIRVESKIPEGSGLGSSAAVSVATSAGLLKLVDGNPSIDEICRLGLIGERSVHGNPSGIDIEASARGGTILFSKQRGATEVKVPDSTEMIVVFSGVARKTSILIAKVRQRQEEFPNYFDELTQATSLLSMEAVDALKADDRDRLGSIMTLAQSSLSWIGVSTPALDRLIEDLMKQGCAGAKITGAGGGGSVIALPASRGQEKILDTVWSSRRTVFVTSLSEAGLSWEKE